MNDVVMVDSVATLSNKIHIAMVKSEDYKPESRIKTILRHFGNEMTRVPVEPQCLWV